MSDEGTNEGAGTGENEGATDVTFGSILPSDMMDNEGNYPNALNDFTDMVIPGADVENESHQAFHKKIGSLAKAYSDTKSMVGGMIKVPGEDASEEDIAAFRGKMGVPEDSGKYEIKMPESEHDSVIFSDDVLTGFKEKAHEAGLSNTHAQFVVDFQADMLHNMAKSMDEEAASGIKDLKAEWGNDFEQNLNQAETYVSKVFSVEAQKKISGLLGNDPDITRGFVKAAQTTLDAGDLKGAGDTLQEDTVKGLQSEIDDLMSSDKYTTGDSSTHAKVTELITKKQKTLGTYNANVQRKQR